MFHDSPMGGHSKVQATYKKLAILLYWKGMQKVVHNYVQDCDICNHHIPENVKYLGHLQPLLPPEGAFMEVAMDFI